MISIPNGTTPSSPGGKLKRSSYFSERPYFQAQKLDADLWQIRWLTEGKIFSLFEPSTESIRKGKAGKPNEFGKLAKLQEAENQIVIDYEVYEQRPNDT